MSATGAMRASPSFKLKSQGNVIDFQYDPEKIKTTKELNFNEKSLIHLAQPLISFKGGKTQSASMSIYFDAHQSPNRDHVANDLDTIRGFQVPRDKSGKLVVSPPAWGSNAVKKNSGKLGGVPPVIDIALGRNRTWTGFLTKLTVTELKHGTTEMTKRNKLCTRAKLDLEFLILEEENLYVDF